MSNTVISIENLSKSYQLGVINTGTFYGDLNRWWAKKRGKPDPYLKIGVADHGIRMGETIWALKDVDLQLQQGEVLGVIGRNAGTRTGYKALAPDDPAGNLPRSPFPSKARSIDSAAVHRRRLNLPQEICSASPRRLRLPKGGLTAEQKSAEGVVGHEVGMASEALRKPKGGAMDTPSRERWPKARTRRSGQ